MELTNIPNNQNIFHIGEFAKIVGLNARTIRRYVEKGILPLRKNPINGRRFFTREDLEKFLDMLKGKEAKNEQV